MAAKRTKRVIHMVKRGNMTKFTAILVRILAVILAMIVCGFVVVGVTGDNPVGVYRGIWDGAFGTGQRGWVTVRETVTLLLIAVGLVPAFKMRYWNLGAEGQILMGGLVSAAVLLYLGPIFEDWLLILIMLAASMAAGLLWGLLPAVFKAYFNTNETLFTLMMNYVAMQIVTFFVILWESPKGSNHVGIINAAHNEGWFPQILGQPYLLDIIIVAVVMALVFIYMTRTKQGYELTVVGESVNTARYAGINVRAVIIRTVLLSSAICGLAGAMIVGGASHTISTSTAGGRGFTAIIVAWMSQFSPVAMIAVSLMLSFMDQGAVQTASQFGLNENVSDIITGILLFFLIGCEFFVRYRLEVTTVEIEDGKERA
ncbi:simple sugar transport system permease protein [Lachnospiraceae bacterium NK3A20]|nr:simple sugar transport system permease protein [Lachnospiraceae bacterium NK3A20]